MDAREPDHSFSMRVSFGDCDPAGIVYYPNIFSWMDRTFHDWLWEFGGHDVVCGKLGSVGAGLMDASAQFRRPMKNGDDITVELFAVEWRDKSVELAYEIKKNGNLLASGKETRGVFILGENGMKAGDVASLRAILQGDTA